MLQENASSEEHVLYVWDHFVSKAAAKNVFIMAHSYGGLSFAELVSVLVFRLSFRPPTYKKTRWDTQCTPVSTITYIVMLENLHIPTLTQVCNTTVNSNPPNIYKHISMQK